MPTTLTLRPSPIRLLRSADAQDAGIRPSSHAALARVRSGVYAPRDEWLALPPWDRYLARVHAYALVAPDAIFALESAAALHGLPVFGEPRFIHVFDPERSHSVRYGDVAVHTSADEREVVGERALMTSIAHTTVDLARLLPRAQALAVIDAALSVRAPKIDGLASLIQIAEEQVARRGRLQLRWLFARADGRAESVGESVSRAVIEWCGFERPDLQCEIHFEGVTDRVDFFWRDRGIVGESDGYGKYDGDDVDAVKAHFLNEKKREDRLRRHVDGFTRWDLADARRVVPLREKLALAGVPLVRPPQPAMLATLRRNPRSIG